MQAEEMRKLGDVELVQKEKDLREETFRLRLRAAAGQTANRMASRAARRELARLLTIQAERKAQAEG
ncbi:MAG: 50S ribosomal protein L29 [Deltaproteobacteria bacterium]